MRKEVVERGPRLLHMAKLGLASYEPIFLSFFLSLLPSLQVLGKMSRGISYSSSSSTLLRCCNSSYSFKSSQSRKEPLLQCATSSSRRSLLRICFEGRKKRASFFTMAATGGAGGGVPHGPLDLTEENVRQVLIEARQELGQLFDGAVGITGEVELADLDGPYVKISLKGRFWHKRSTVVARLGNYLQQRIPEILEVEIEDEKQLDDSPASF